MKNRLAFLICNVVILIFALTGVSYAETFCLDILGYCNDMRIRTDTIGTATTGNFRVWGHEYGCGYNDRQVYGSLRIKNGIWYTGLTVTGSGSGYVTTKTIVARYNYSTGSGTYKIGYVDSDGFVDYAAGTLKKITCPAISAASMAAEPNEPDMFH